MISVKTVKFSGIFVLFICLFKYGVDTFNVKKVDANTVAKFYHDFSNEVEKLESKLIEANAKDGSLNDGNVKLNDKRKYDLTLDVLKDVLNMKLWFYARDLIDLDCDPQMKETSDKILNTFNVTYTTSIITLFKEKRAHPKEFKQFMSELEANNNHQEVETKFDEMEKHFASKKLDGARQLTQRMRGITIDLKKSFDEFYKQYLIVMEMLYAHRENSTESALEKQAEKNEKVEVFNDLA